VLTLHAGAFPADTRLATARKRSTCLDTGDPLKKAAPTIAGGAENGTSFTRDATKHLNGSNTNATQRPAYRHFAGIESLSALLLLYPHTQILGVLVSSCHPRACFLPSIQFSKPQFTVPPVGMTLIIWTAVIRKTHFV
jgi:hypothetical protein